MESQVLFNIIVGISGAAGGWILKVIWDAIKTLDTDVKALGSKLHAEFVRREDFRESTQELKSDMRDGFGRVEKMLGTLFDRLENKADK